MTVRWLLIVLALAGVPGCGYHLMGTQITLPPDVHSVSVTPFDNRSREFGLEKTLAFALEREFHRRGILTVVETPGKGDAVLSGVIRRFRVRPVAFNSVDQAIQYEAELVLDVELRRQSDNTVIWQTDNLQEIEDYSVNASVVVPSSSQFQRGTLNPNDINNLTNIQLAETEKQLAIQRIVAEVVRDVHDRIVEDF
jgi:outer membrane lipopolysaccharide assembly protein LptE/RlpB